MEEFLANSSVWHHNIKPCDKSTSNPNTLDATNDLPDNSKDVNENHASEDTCSGTNDLEESKTIPNGASSNLTLPSEELFAGLQSAKDNTIVKSQVNRKKTQTISSFRNTESATIKQRLETLLAAREESQLESLNLNFSESESSDTSEAMNSEGTTPTVPKTGFPSIEGLPNTANQERELLARVVDCESPVCQGVEVPFLCTTIQPSSKNDVTEDEAQYLEEIDMDLDNIDDEDVPSEASLSASSKLLQDLVVIRQETTHLHEPTTDSCPFGVVYPKDWDLELTSTDDNLRKPPEVKEAFTEHLQLKKGEEEFASSDSVMQQQMREDSGIDLKSDSDKKAESSSSEKQHEFDEGVSGIACVKPHVCAFLGMEEYWESDPTENNKNTDDSETVTHSWTDIDISQRLLRRRQLSKHDRRRTRSSSPTSLDAIEQQQLEQGNKELCVSSKHNDSDQCVFPCENNVENSKEATNGHFTLQKDRSKILPNNKTVDWDWPALKLLNRNPLNFAINGESMCGQDDDKTSQVSTQCSDSTGHSENGSHSANSPQTANLTDVESPSDESIYNQGDLLASLPTEITMKIYSYLTPKELLLYVAPVCKKWKELAHDPILWQSLCVNANETIDSYDLCKIIRGATLLKHLSLRARDELNITEVKMITVHCTHLQSLDLGFCDNVNEKIIGAITQNCNNLETVNVEGCERITDKCISFLASLPKLKSLNVSHCIKITDTGVNTLAVLCEKLEEVNIDGIPWITDNAVKLLANERKEQLKAVYLDGAEMTDTSIEYISKCKNLQVLSVSFAEQFTDISLRHVQSLQNLKYLRLKRGVEYSDHCLTQMFLCPNLHQLTFLNLTECSELSDKALEHLAKGEMETLDLLGLDKILGMCLMKIPDSMPNMKKLLQVPRIASHALHYKQVQVRSEKHLPFNHERIEPFKYDAHVEHAISVVKISLDGINGFKSQGLSSLHLAQ
ncbi:uncharacterized protein LOC144439385 [Glandiceps talaboti]